MDLEPLLKLTKDLKNAATTLDENEVRFLVDNYYQMQNNRIRSSNQARALGETGEPHEILLWLGGQAKTLENQIRNVLNAYAQSHMMGPWLYSVSGIGPVISAGLLAYIDIEIADTAGKIWSFAGIDVGRLDKPWKKGEKRPWCADFRTLCWKIGESFVKVSGKEEAFYGQYYAKTKLDLLEKNEGGGFSNLAEKYLKEYKLGKTTEAYKAYIEGRLPPAHIHAMAKRKAVKLFLSHLQQIWYEKHHGKPAPKPFVIAHMDHKDYIAPKVA